MKAWFGLHAFTRNDYVASLLRKVKPFCRKLGSSDPMFLEMFRRFGAELHLSEELFGALENMYVVVVW